MKIKHIVFDWDGTLADTYPVISAAYNHVFKTLNLPPLSYDEIKRLTSTLQNKDTLGVIFGNRKDEAKTAYYDYIRKHHVSELRGIPFAKELLQFCKDNDFRTYLLTNKRRPYFLEEADKLGFTEFFNKIAAAGDFQEDKPHPAATHALFDNHLPDADSILVVGDGEADFQVARSFDHNGKKAFCAICDSAQKYSGPQPDYLVQNLNEIISVLTSCL